MKKIKAILALVLVAILLVTLFAACAESESVQDNNTPSDAGSDTQDKAPAGNDSEEEEEEDGQAQGELVTIRFLYDDSRSCADYADRIEARINELVEPLIGVHVDIDYVSSGDFKTKTIVTLAGGEVYDLMSVNPRLPLENLYSATVLMDITDLFREYAPDAYEIVEQYLPACSYDGSLYCIPAMRSYLTNNYIGMRKDILDELGLTEQAQNISSWSEYEQILAAVKENYTDQGTGLYAVSQAVNYCISYPYAVMGESGRFEDYLVNTVQDSYGMACADQDGNVFSRMSSAGYVAECKQVASWMDKGYLFPDAPFSEDSGYDLIKQGVSFSMCFRGEYGTEVAFRDKTGYECVVVKVYDGMITTDVPSAWSLGIPITSEEPEAACRFVNLMYTNSELMNLFVRGEEGVDYEVVDGQVRYLSDQVYKNYDWGVGNQLILTPLEGNGADFYDRVAEVNASAPVSPFLGFVIDASKMDYLISQISSVRDEYRQLLECGGYTQEAYEACLTKLEHAGIDDYVQQIQDQLDAWRAQQG